MAIHKFYMLYKGLQEALGEAQANELFPEYSQLPDKMPPLEQAELGRTIMTRMDESLDKETIIRIRHAHTCNLTQKQIKDIIDLKEKYKDFDDFCIEYSKLLAPGSVKKDKDILIVSFGWKKCVCGMFRKLKEYEAVSQTWCECCNGHVIKHYSFVCGKRVSSEIVETVACGKNDCVFKINM